MKSNPLPPRLDRMFPLSAAATYPGNAAADMVLYLPAGPAAAVVNLRLWLFTTAERPEVAISSRTFTAAGRGRGDCRWVDFGTVATDDPCFGPRGFAILRVRGLTAEQLAAAVFMTTAQRSREPEGTPDEVQTAFWGLARRDAGTTSLSPSRIEVGKPAVLDLVYRAGPRGLPPGSRMRLAFPKAFSAPQTDDAEAPGFLSVPAPAVPVTVIEAAPSVESHERVDAFLELPDGLPADAAVHIRYRTDFVYLFPRCWHEEDRRYWYSPQPPMAVAVAVDERGVFVPPAAGRGHTLEVVPGPATLLHLFLPGRLRAGMPATLTGVFTDAYRNIPSGAPGNTDLRLVLTGADAAEVDLGTPGGHFAERCRFVVPLPALPPGVYRARAVQASDGGTVADSNPFEVTPADSPRPCIFWGEIHGHTEQSDGTGAYVGLFEHARRVGRLDFAAAADHACYFSDNDWQWMQDAVNHRNEDGRFVTLIGYEWAGKQGHRNIYTSRDRLSLCRGMYPGTTDIADVYPRFATDPETVAGPHTRHTGDFFSGHDPRIQRFLEIYSMWGAFEELAWDLLNRGAVIGLTGGGDCHEARCGFSVCDPDGQGRTPHTFAPGLCYKCGLTAAVMPHLTRRGLVEALRRRRTYATTGARILLDVSAGDLAMGDRGRTTAALTLSISVHGTAPIAAVEIIRNGAVVHRDTPGTADACMTWSDPPLRDNRWYVVRVTQNDGERAWTSPIWMSAPAPSTEPGLTPEFASPAP